MTNEERKTLQNTIFRLSKEKLELQAENERLKAEIKRLKDENNADND